MVQAITDLAARNTTHDSDRLTAEDARPAIAEALRGAVQGAYRASGVDANLARLLDRTAKNSLRVPFLDAVFPDAMFVYVYREPREALASMIGAWESGKFVTHPQLADWTGPPWSLVLVPGWERLRGADLAEIVLRQWEATTRILLDDLERLPPGQWAVLDRGALVGDPQPEIERICAFLGIEWEKAIASPLPLSRHTGPEAAPARWKRQEAAIEELLPRTAELAERAREWIARPKGG